MNSNELGTHLDRRTALGSVAAVGAALLIPGCAASGAQPSPVPAKPSPDLDSKIMTFALNLEYMEAEYYTRGAFGHSLAAHGGETGRKPCDVRGGHKVNFSNPAFAGFAEELAQNEIAHVAFYRRMLGGAAIDMPVIDFDAAFAGAAAAAGLVKTGEPFDAFANEINFFLGGMLIEDVGVTAYHAAASLITSKKVLDAAAGILAVEAHHMGMVRALLYQAGAKAQEAANAISKARDAIDGHKGLDQGIAINGRPNFVPSDADGIAFSRTPRQVLDIVYLKNGADRGGFYPDGMNGDLAGLV